MLAKRICMVGLGLMGGSLALALRPFLTYLAIVDTNSKTRQAARQFADLTTADFATGARDADLVVLATPARVILRQLAQLPVIRPDGCLVMDLGSTKAEICRVMEQLPPTFQAIGGHPMCGKETAGFAAADPDLYRGETFVLCRNGRTTPHVESVAQEIIKKIGAVPLELPPDRHDRLVAATSHLPYLAAAVLMQTAAAQNDSQQWQVSATGFRDTTRLAGSDAQMMLDILLTNRTAVIEQVENLQAHLTQLERLLVSGDDAELANWLAEAQQRHTNYQNEKSNLRGFNRT